MKYAVIAVVDGNFIVHSEHGNVDAAIMEYHSYAKALRGDANTKVYKLEVVDEDLNVYQNYSEFENRNAEPIE